MRFLFHKPAGNTNSFSQPDTAELTDEVVGNLRLGPPLKRMCRKLTEQFRKMDVPAIGIQINSIEFSIIYDLDEGAAVNTIHEGPPPSQT